VNIYYLNVKGSVKLGVNFSVMFHSTNGNDFCSETGSRTASLLCGSTVGYPSDSLASCSSRTSKFRHSLTKKRQLLVPQTPYRALPLDSTGGLPSPDLLGPYFRTF